MNNGAALRRGWADVFFSVTQLTLTASVHFVQRKLHWVRWYAGVRGGMLFASFFR